MADPFSISVGVIAVITAFLQTSQALVSFTSDVKGAPKELHSITRDVAIFDTLATSLQDTLSQARMVEIIESDRSLRGLMGNIKNALEGCANARNELLAKLYESTSVSSAGKQFIRDVKWPFKKKDILAHIQRLADSKDTLNAAFGGTTLVLSLRTTSSVEEISRSQLLSRDAEGLSVQDADVGTALSTYAATLNSASDSISSRSLIAAAKDDNLDLVEKLLDQGAYVDATDPSGITALHWATQRNAKDLVRLLLERKASIDLAMADGNTALHLSTLYHTTEIIECLLDHHANVNAVNHEGETPLDLVMQFGESRLDTPEGYELIALLLANRAGLGPPKDGLPAFPRHSQRVQTLRRLLDRTAPTYDNYVHGYNLMCAVRDDNKSAALDALKRGAAPDFKDYYGWTPLLWAVYHQRLELVVALLDNKAQVHVQTTESFKVDTGAKIPGRSGALHIAARSGLGGVSIITLLLNHNALLEADDENGNTPLHVAFLYGSEEAALALLKAGADFQKSGHKSRTPIDCAASEAKPTVVRAMLDAVEREGLDLAEWVTYQDGKLYRQPILHNIARSHGMGEVLVYLASRGVDLCCRDTSGFTPLHEAAAWGSWTSCDTLVQLAWAQGIEDYVDITDDDGRTPADMARLSCRVVPDLRQVVQDLNRLADDLETAFGRRPPPTKGTSIADSIPRSDRGAVDPAILDEETWERESDEEGKGDKFPSTTASPLAGTLPGLSLGADESKSHAHSQSRPPGAEEPD